MYIKNTTLTRDLHPHCEGFTINSELFKKIYIVEVFASFLRLVSASLIFLISLILKDYISAMRPLSISTKAAEFRSKVGISIINVEKVVKITPFKKRRKKESVEQQTEGSPRIPLPPCERAYWPGQKLFSLHEFTSSSNRCFCLWKWARQQHWL